MIGALHDLNVVVVEARQARGGNPPGNAPLEQRSIGPGIGAAARTRGAAASPATATAAATPTTGVDERRDAAVRRIDDQRRAPIVVHAPARIGPVRRVDRPRLVGLFVGRRFVHPLAGGCLERLHFRVREVLAIAVLRATLERRDGLVVPGPLQVRMPPRRTRDGRRRALRLAALAQGRRASGRRLRKQTIGRHHRGDQESGQDESSHSHSWLLRFGILVGSLTREFLREIGESVPKSGPHCHSHAG